MVKQNAERETRIERLIEYSCGGAHAVIQTARARVLIMQATLVSKNATRKNEQPTEIMK